MGWWWGWWGLRCMCFYFSVHVKAVLKLVVICWNALLSTPKKTSIKEDADLIRYCLFWVLAPMFPGFSDDWSWEGSWLITCLDWIYRLVDTCCLFVHALEERHTLQQRLCLLFCTNPAPPPLLLLPSMTQRY